MLYSGKTVTFEGYSGKHQQKCIEGEIKLQKYVIRENVPTEVHCLENTITEENPFNNNTRVLA